MGDLEYQGHKNRRQQAKKLWYQVIAEYKSGESAIDIAKKYDRSRSWVYWVLKKYKNEEI